MPLQWLGSRYDLFCYQLHKLSSDYFQIISGQLPFYYARGGTFVKLILIDKKRPDWSRYTVAASGQPCMSIVEDCWKHDPNSRPDMRQVAQRLRRDFTRPSSHVRFGYVVPFPNPDGSLPSVCYQDSQGAIYEKHSRSNGHLPVCKALPGTPLAGTSWYGKDGSKVRQFVFLCGIFSDVDLRF
jgi:hypothetical protein